MRQSVKRKTMFKIFKILVFICFSLNLAAQTAASLEIQARKTPDKREKMSLLYKAAERYLGANPDKASQLAHQAYIIATEDLKDYTMATRAAFLNAEGYARQREWSNAKFRYNRSKESAQKANDVDWTVRSLMKMSDMAKNEGNAAEAEAFRNQASDLKKRPNTEGVAASSYGNRPSATTSSNPSTASTILPSPSANRPAPTNQVEMNSLREQFRRQTEQLERDRQRMISEVNMLKKEKESLNNGMTQLRVKERNLTVETEQAKHTIAQKTQQLAVVEEQKDQIKRVATKKQKLVEALRNENLLDSIAYSQDRQEQEFQLQKAHNFRNILLLVLGFALMIVGLIYKRYVDNQKQRRILVGKNKIIEDERQRSDELLLNILPAAIAAELKSHGKAKAQRYERASVLFTDFINFTSISERLSPEQLVTELDTYFKAFDFIIAQYKLEKIKTIGDAYMCASGLSDKISSPINIVKAALELQQFLNEMKIEKIRKGEPYFEARIGINTGPVVAGVVGINKFAYDIWGDTVNIAARIQEACEPGCINISEATHREIQYTFKCHYRGKLPAKNKGDIEMYYVENANLLQAIPPQYESQIMREFIV